MIGALLSTPVTQNPGGPSGTAPTTWPGSWASPRREPDPSPRLRVLARTSLRFLIDAQDAGGRYRNRLSRWGRWEDAPALEDCWGRSLWALGTAVSHSGDGWVCEAARTEFERAARRRSLPVGDGVRGARRGGDACRGAPPSRGAALLVDAAEAMAPPLADVAWPWPEARLRYANAVLPEAMIAAGAALDRQRLLRQGLDLLAWLLEHQTRDRHLSVTPVGGSGPGDARPAFDQQPIEIAAIADTCALAGTVDGDRCWVEDRGRRGLVSRGQRRSPRHVGPGHRRRLRRPHGARAQPQPGNRVKLGPYRPQRSSRLVPASR